jgi:hypothetical protein
MIHLLKDSCTIAPKTGSDRYSDKSYGAGIVTKCRFVLANEKLQIDKGNVVNITAIFQMKGSCNSEDKITYQSKNYEVVKVENWKANTNQIYGSYVKCIDYPTN